MDSELVCRIALTRIPGVGPVKARMLVSFCGSAEAVFHEKAHNLLRIPEIGTVTVEALLKGRNLEGAEKEAEFIAHAGIQSAWYSDPDYPTRLRQCEDAPALLFWKGVPVFDNERVVAVVGTRRATAYGREQCDALIDGLAPLGVTVVSGLAVGIDVCAHRAALRNGLPTVGCLAHGLSTVYPPSHTHVAREMLEGGALVTEFSSEVKPDPPLFPSRNRIIAGLADCTVVVESDQKGGSLITAYLANGYGREVFAFPGRVKDQFSTGCHQLIRRNAAALITSAADLAEYMSWHVGTQKSVVQTALFEECTAEENELMQVLRQHKRTSLDDLGIRLERSSAHLSSMLLELEFRGYVRSLPGKMYEAVRG